MAANPDPAARANRAKPNAYVKSGPKDAKATRTTKSPSRPASAATMDDRFPRAARSSTGASITPRSATTSAEDATGRSATRATCCQTSSWRGECFARDVHPRQTPAPPMKFRLAPGALIVLVSPVASLPVCLVWIAAAYNGLVAKQVAAQAQWQ